MNIDRLWVIAAVAGMIVVAVGGWFVGISPIVAQASTTDAQLTATKTANTSSEAKLALLRTEFTTISKLRKSLNSLRGSIPEEADASAFVQELNQLSAEYGVSLTSVTINAATVYAAPAAPAPPASATGSGSTPTPTPTPTSTAPAAPTTTTVVPTGGLVLIPVVIVVTGTFDAVRDFDGAVQGGKRLYLATSAQISSNVAAAASSSSVTGTLTGDIFTIAGTSPPTKSVVPTPIPTPTPTATSIPTPTATPTPTLTPKP
jgi:hypothetical protein